MNKDKTKESIIKLFQQYEKEILEHIDEKEIIISEGFYLDFNVEAKLSIKHVESDMEISLISKNTQKVVSFRE